MDPEIKYRHGVDDEDIIRTDSRGIGVARLKVVIKFASASGRQPFIEDEKRAYEQLGHHNRILHYYGKLGDNIVLQHASHGSITEYLASQTELPPISVRVGWVEQIAEAVAFMHSKNVFHSGISCDNIFLDQNLNTKIGNFAGSLIDGYHFTSDETSHVPNLGPPWAKHDFFDLGSTFYEIMTGSKPSTVLSQEDIFYKYLDDRNCSRLNVSVMFYDVIVACWTRTYGSADELLGDMKTGAAAISANIS